MSRRCGSRPAKFNSPWGRVMSAKARLMLRSAIRSGMSLFWAAIRGTSLPNEIEPGGGGTNVDAESEVVGENDERMPGILGGAIVPVATAVSCADEAITPSTPSCRVELGRTVFEKRSEAGFSIGTIGVQTIAGVSATRVFLKNRRNDRFI